MHFRRTTRPRFYDPWKCIENALNFFPCDICQRFYDELLVVFRFRKSLVPRGKLRSEFLATSIPGPEKTMAQLSEVFLEGETPQWQ
jgi:hypothetical protein